MSSEIVCGTTGEPVRACRHCAQLRRDAQNPKKVQWAGRMKVELSQKAKVRKLCALDETHVIQPGDLQAFARHFYGRMTQRVGLVCQACAMTIRRKGRPARKQTFREHLHPLELGRNAYGRKVDQQKEKARGERIRKQNAERAAEKSEEKARRRRADGGK